MAELYTKNNTIEEIVKEAKKLSKLDLQILLNTMRVKQLKKKSFKKLSEKPADTISMQEIDAWKHNSRV